MNNLIIDPIYNDMDADIERFFHHFNEPKESLILEIGCNQEWAAHILTDNGYKVMGIDLLSHHHSVPPVNYFRLRGDFCELARPRTGSGLPPPLSPTTSIAMDESFVSILPQFDAIFSTSAIEHFGLRTYPGCPGIPDYDAQAMRYMHNLLKPGGSCYITVPYGKDFITHNSDWRVYNAKALNERIIGNFSVDVKEFFKSDECLCPSKGREVTEEDANQYGGDPPHLTVFLKMRKVLCI